MARQQKQKLVRTKVRKRVIYPVEEGLDSEETQKQYRWQFDTFLKWVGLRYSVITPEILVGIEPSELTGLIIEYLSGYMHKQKGLKYSTRKNAQAAIMHFLDINDVDINRRKISKFVIRDKGRRHTDRAYTREEIEILYDIADERFKAIIMLLANGMRIGAVPELRIGDLTKIELVDQPKLYQIKVYAGTPSEYYTFVTPECAKAIDNYLNFRKNQGEKNVYENVDAPLIREQFLLDNTAQASKPRKIGLASIEKTLERIIRRSGINTLGGVVMMSHGFRKWAITQMKKAKVDYSDREYLVGHRLSRKLDVNYDRTEERDRLEEWAKSINNLTINPAFQLEKELEIAKTETAQTFARQKQEIESLKTQLEEKDKQLRHTVEALETKSKNSIAKMEKQIIKLNDKLVELTTDNVHGMHIYKTLESND